MKQILELFTTLDIDGSGMLDKQEIRKIIDGAEIQVASDVLDALLDIFDEDQNGEISYSEFVAMMQNKEESRLELEDLSEEDIAKELQELQASWKASDSNSSEE